MEFRKCFQEILIFWKFGMCEKEKIFGKRIFSFCEIKLFMCFFYLLFTMCFFYFFKLLTLLEFDNFSFVHNWQHNLKNNDNGKKFQCFRLIYYFRYLFIYLGSFILGPIYLFISLTIFQFYDYFSLFNLINY